MVVTLILGSFTLMSQNLATQRKTNQFTEHIDRFNENDIYDIKDPSTYEGTPYNNYNFLIGNVYLNNEIISKGIGLRYNIYNDEIEVKESLQNDNSDIKSLTKSSDINVSILNTSYVFLPIGQPLSIGGYFKVSYRGDNLILYKKLQKKFYPPKKAATSLTKDILATFIDRHNYYLVSNEGKYFEIPNSKNKFLKLFVENKEAVKNYIKEGNIDINKEKDLVRLVNYIDGLNISEL